MRDTLNRLIVPTSVYTLGVDQLHKSGTLVWDLEDHHSDEDQEGDTPGCRLHMRAIADCRNPSHRKEVVIEELILRIIRIKITIRVLVVALQELGEGSQHPVDEDNLNHN